MLMISSNQFKMRKQQLKDMTVMCAEGGFQLIRFVSNSKDVLVSISKGERRKGI